MHINVLFLLCAFLAVCSELAAYQGNDGRVRGTLVRRALDQALARRGYSKNAATQPRYYRRSSTKHISEAHVGEHPVEVHVPVPQADIVEQEINIPVEEHVDFVDEPEVLVHEAPSAHDQEESEVPVESLVSPLEHEELLPLLAEPVVHESAPKPEDLSSLYDYMYPMVLRKCLASAIYSTMGLNSEDPNANYNHQMRYIDHPLVQISGLDRLEELRRNITAVEKVRRLFRKTPKATTGCVFHFNEIDADMQAAAEDLLTSYGESVSEERFRSDNMYILKHERLFKKEFMMHLIVRKLYGLLRNHASIYNVILALDDDLEKYINYWNTKN